MFKPVYFDHNATSAVDERALAAMMPYLAARVGNPSSRHEYGRDARRAVDAAREQVAALVGAHPTEVVFTSGGTEANNLFIKGAAESLRPSVVAVSAVEHPSVLGPAEQLHRRGWQRKLIAVDGDGRVSADAAAAALGDSTPSRPGIVSVMAANNETGVVQDLPTIAARLRASGAWFHTDAVQSCGRLALDFRELKRLGVHALSISAHKLHGPKGAGALIVDKRIELAPLLAGGGQERGLRSGTENVAAIVGFGEACALAAGRRAADAAHTAALRDRLEAGLARLGARIFAAAAGRLPNTSFFAIDGIDGETLVGRLDRAGYACASGSACSSADPEPSHVLRAMGIEPTLARGSVRVSLGRDNTAGEVDGFLAALEDTVAALRGLASIAA